MDKGGKITLRGNAYLEDTEIHVKRFKAFGDLEGYSTCDDADVAILTGDRFDEFEKLIVTDQRIDLALVVLNSGEKTVVFLNDQFDYDLLGDNFHPHCNIELFYSLLKDGSDTSIQLPVEKLPAKKIWWFGRL